jgi:hypothetical protein
LPRVGQSEAATAEYNCPQDTTTMLAKRARQHCKHANRLGHLYKRDALAVLANHSYRFWRLPGKAEAACLRL